MFVERVYAAGELAEPVKQLINRIIEQLVEPFVLLLFGVALLYFLWGVYQYMIDNSADKRKDRQKHLISGVVGLTIMVCVWGILQFISNNVACQ
jgi:phosphatidylglycerophosphatase A